MLELKKMPLTGDRGFKSLSLRRLVCLTIEFGGR
jgi:hypothetical protein